MDSAGISSGVNNSAFSASAAPKPENINPQITTQQVVKTSNDIEATINKDPEQSRLDALKKASRSAIRSFPVSDQRFTIYKEFAIGDVSSATFVTRFTNLETGEVTLIREPELLMSFSKESGTLLDGSI